MAKPYLESDPESTIYSIKRLMGKSYKDLETKKSNIGYRLHEDSTENLIKINIRGKYFTPIELSSFILSNLKLQAEQSLNTVLENVVITVPAYFNDNQRQATRDAGKLAGLNVLRIINEPTAACLAYGIGLDRQESKIIAVYDLGGGTFDISILRVEDGVFDVLSTRGDTNLGGDDFDQAIIQYWSDKYKDGIQFNLNKIRLLAEEAKKIVNEGEIFSSRILSSVIELSPDEFKLISDKLIEKTIECCKLAILDSKLTIDQIDSVILVGGSTRLKLVREAIKNFFNRTPDTSLNPDYAIATGAAIQADILAGNRKDLLLLDINPLSLGIETLGGIMDVIIPRNSKIPIQLAREYTTSKDGQINLKISVYQGERDLVENNRKLGEFILKNIPPMPAGIPKIQVRFSINADGILNVKAKELRTNIEQEVLIKSQFSLSPEIIAKMLSESIQFANQDMEIKSLIDTVNEANALLLATEKFINENTEHLSKKEILILNEHKLNLQKSIQTSIKNDIQISMDALNSFSTPIAHRIMDMNIQAALRNQEILKSITEEINQDGQKIK